MNDQPLRLSVVMPAYNEEEAIRDAVADVQQHVLGHVSPAELVVVNDGSRDATGSILDELAREDPRVRVVHQQNSGHGPSVINGLELATGEYVFLLDSDRQIALDGFSAFWAEAERGRDCVFGVRRVRHDPKLRLWLTRRIRSSIGLMFGVKIHDANVPFKLLRRSVWTEASAYIPRDTLAPSLFLAVFAKVRGYEVKEIDVPHKERDTGEVSIRRFKLLKFCAKAFRQMWDFRRRLADAG